MHSVNNVPRHIAIIMDGNGRWAQAKKYPRIFGHKEGAKAVRKISTECVRLGVEQLTLYTFSMENWQRPVDEVEFLMDLLAKFVVKERKNIMENNIYFSTIGRLDMVPRSVRQEIEKTKEMSSLNTGMKLCLALSYSGRAEIVDSAKKIAQKILQGTMSIEDIDEKTFSENLYQSSMPDPELLIRTGGDMRVSNFLLWQISYTELWVTPKMWPDFKEEDLHAALESFANRERRFGKVTPSARISV